VIGGFPLITLASASPRRVELLQRLGVSCLVVPSHAPEEEITPATITARFPDLSPGECARRVTLERTRAKAALVPPQPGTEVALAADTTVAVEGEILDKPLSEAETREMLRRLSGITHHVHTAVRVYTSHGFVSEAVVTTAVEMRSVTDVDLDWYLESEEWRGVAGGYRIQGRGSAFIQTIHGNPDAVMGLPTAVVYSILCSLKASA
jgi:septum formation protein